MIKLCLIDLFRFVLHFYIFLSTQLEARLELNQLPTCMLTSTTETNDTRSPVSIKYWKALRSQCATIRVSFRVAVNKELGLPISSSHRWRG